MFRRRWLKRQVLTRVIVYTTEGSTLDGVLAEDAKDGIVLRHVKVVPDQGDPQPVPGSVFVAREHLDFLQVLTTGPY